MYTQRKKNRLEVFLDLFEKKEPFELEYRFQYRDGSYRWVINRGVPRLGEDGDFAGYIGSVLDVNNMKEQEDHLRQAATVFDNTMEGLMITDASGNIKAVNPAFTSVTGYSIEENLEKNPRILNSGKQDKAYYEDMWL